MMRNITTWIQAPVLVHDGEEWKAIVHLANGDVVEVTARQSAAYPGEHLGGYARPVSLTLMATRSKLGPVVTLIPRCLGLIWRGPRPRRRPR